MSTAHSYFITGTDTGVGKTLVAGGLARALVRSGLTVGVLKPCESGCGVSEGELVPHDAVFLKKMSGCREPLDLLCPYRFEQPLAPAVAASFESSSIDMDRIRDIFREIKNTYNVVLVEGAGGLLVPVTEQHLMADMAHLLSIPVLVVARLSLGTINHSLLTIRQAQACGLTVAGVIFNQTEPVSGTAERTNPDIIHRYSGIPVIGQVSFIPEAKRHDEDCIADCIAAGIDMHFFKQHC